MARYLEPVCKLCRQFGLKMFFKGTRCFTDKCSFERRPFVVTAKGTKKKKKISDYGLQLKEKQKARKTYGMMESQFRVYYQKAARMKGPTGVNLLQLLERRLDNVVFHLGFASSRQQARQLVTHNHFTVNGKKQNIPSAFVTTGDIVELKEKSRNNSIITENLAIKQQKGTVSWLELDVTNFKGKILKLPDREDITVPVEEQLIVELYSK
jgi:small subunit ribosomal protein S4